jgi:hypothetical protein
MDPWVEPGSPLVEVVIVPEDESWDETPRVFLTTTPKQGCEGATTLLEVESGSAIVVRDSDTWTNIYTCSAPFYLVTMVAVHPLRVSMQYGAKYPHRTVAGLEKERRIVPAIHSAAAQRLPVPLPYRPEPAREDDLPAVEDEVVEVKEEEKKKRSRPVVRKRLKT